jgi:hypothetical protein
MLGQSTLFHDSVQVKTPEMAVELTDRRKIDSFESSNSSRLCYLPLELKQEIFGRLSAKDLCQISVVSVLLLPF